MLTSSSIGSFASNVDGKTCVLAFLLVGVAVAIKRAILSPLRNVPGPFLCRISDLPAIIMAGRGQKAVWTHSLFQKYGPLVRTGPFSQIYGQSWVKADFYDGLMFEGKMHLLGVRDPKEAVKRRRAIMPTFSTANLKATTPLIHSYIEQFTVQVEAAQRDKGSVDVFRWYRLLAFDIIALIHAGITYGVASTLIPGLDLIITIFGTSGMRLWKSAQRTLGLMGTALYREHMLKPFDERSSSIISSFQAHYVASGCDAAATETLVACEAAALLIAGSDTTSMTMVYLTYLLALNPQVQERLQAELDAALPDRDHLPVVSELDRLRYLGAVIKEILRLHPAVPGAVLDGFLLPGGTTVTCQPYSINRIPAVFGDDADHLNPDRFLDEPPEMKQASFAFSYGPRNCAGMNLANAELKILTAFMFRRYTIT
ncbi:hypothetical protein RQP46_011436 [Phenoliferia psychrophenolica]